MLSLFNIFRIVAFLEGLSYILLLFIATPIKHFGDNPFFVKLLGLPHGLLFMAYIILAILLNAELKWSSKVFRNILLAAIVPFGTFYIDRLYLRTQNNG